MTTWDGGTRERALDALRLVLAGIEGVKTVRREPPALDLVVSDTECPAILIDDTQAAFAWLERHGRRIQGTKSSVLLDCHAVATQTQGRAALNNAATLRNAFVRRIMLELADNPRLRCRLPGIDDEAVAHAKDCAHAFQLRNLPIAPPWIRFGLVLDLEVDDELDLRTRTNWRSVTLTIQPEQPGIVLPSEREVEMHAEGLLTYFEIEHADTMLGLWTCDGPRLRDVSGNGYDLATYEPSTLQVTTGDLPLAEPFKHATHFGGGVAWRRLVDAHAADFEVDRDAYELANLGRAQSFSLVALASRDSDLGADQAIMGWAGPSGAYVQMYTNDDGETRVRILGNDDGNVEQDEGGGSGEIGDIDLHVVVVDRELDELRVYQGATEVATLAGVTALVGGLEAHADSIFGLGAYAVGPVTSTDVETPTAVQTPYSGRVQLAAVVSRALTDSDVTWLRDLAGLG